MNHPMISRWSRMKRAVPSQCMAQALQFCLTSWINWSIVHLHVMMWKFVFYHSSSDEDINQNNKATVNKQREENADDRKSPSSENKQKRHRSRSSRRSSSRSTTRSHSPRLVQSQINFENTGYIKQIKMYGLSFLDYMELFLWLR